jgi:uncharacterized protein YkwD
MQSHSRSRRGAALSAALLAALVVAPGSLGSGFAVTRAESHLAGLINGFRTAHGLRPLRVDAKLAFAARAHSRDMLRRGYFGHGAFPLRLHRFGVRTDPIGENIAWGVGARGEAREVLHLWIGSPGHRANLLGPHFHRIGLGMPVGPFGGFRWTRVVTADFAG